MTLTGTPTWTAAGLGGRVQVLDFNSAHPDYLQCSAVGSTDLNFTSEDFSITFWCYPISTGTYMVPLCRGATNSDGWFVRFEHTGAGMIVYILTNQAGTQQATRTFAVVKYSAWNIVTIVRAGTKAVIYCNGVFSRDSAGTHTNPLTSNRKLHIGIYDDETTYPFSGYFYFPRIWSRALSPEEVMYLFQTERGIFGI